MRRSFKYLIRPNVAQRAALTATLGICCELYNACLQERRDGWKKRGLSVGATKQMAELPAVKAERPDVAGVYAQVLQSVVRRVDRSFVAFFRRAKSGQRPGYPRFRSRRRYDSFTFPQVGRSGVNGGVLVLTTGRLQVHGVPGVLKVNWHRPMEGRVKTATLKREGDRWYVIFSCDDVPAKPLPPTDKACGVDVGLKSFAVLDDGTVIANPRHLEHAEASLKRAQRVVSRRKRGSRRRDKARRLLAKQHGHVANQRRDFHHKTARRLVGQYDQIAVEKLNIAGLSAGMLSKSVHSAGWGQFFTFLRDKAEEAGRAVVEVNPAGSTQQCSGCGASVPKDLSVRVHKCPHCGLVLDRDVNAARNIRACAFGARKEPSGRAA